MVIKSYKKKKKSLFVIIFICFVFVLFISLYEIYDHYYNVNFTKADYLENYENIKNPYCGFYGLYAYKLVDYEKDFTNVLNDNIKKNSEYSLALIEINISDFKDREISSQALSQIHQIFSFWKDSGTDIIVRFLYDYDGKASDYEPKESEIVLTHIKQCSEIVNLYDDCIYIMQGVFIGNYGEMNGSHFMDDKTWILFAKLLDNIVSDKIYLAVRTPAQLRELFEETNPEKLIESDKFRWSIYNDGMMGSETDTGTFASAATTTVTSLDRSGLLSQNIDFSKKWIRQEELNFISSLCGKVPDGGEVIIPNKFNDCENAVESLKKMRVSYLNYMYDDKVLSKWKNQIYDGIDSYNYENISYYDYIKMHLGYRYILEDVTYSYKTFSDKINFKFEISNNGYAPLYRNSNLVINIVSPNGDIVFSKRINDNNRLLIEPKNKIYVSTELDTNMFIKESCDIYISLSSEDDKIINFCNKDNTKYGLLVGSIKLNHLQF